MRIVDLSELELTSQLEELSAYSIGAVMGKSIAIFFRKCGYRDEVARFIAQQVAQFACGLVHIRDAGPPSGEQGTRDDNDRAGGYLTADS